MLQSNKIDILPNALEISKESIWQVLNNIASILIVDINDQKILFANPNSIKELRVIEDDSRLVLSEAIDRKLKLPLTYGEKNSFEFTLKENIKITIEFKMSIVSWDKNPAYLLILSSSICL